MAGTAPEVKRRLITACQKYVEERIAGIMNGIKDLEDALKLETKCSMGDKYETGRAMLHLEFEKLSAQLEQYRRLKKTLSFITEKPGSGKVGFGSVVKSNHTSYFISIPAGILQVQGEKYYAIGAGSPIAQAMLGKEKEEDFVFNGTSTRITEIL